MPRKSRATKTTEPVAEATPATNVVEAPAPVEAAAPEEPSLTETFNSLLAQLSSLRSQITQVSSEVRSVRSRAEREIRAAQKATKKRRTVNRAPSGFVKPTQISSELAKFLGKDKGTLMARTEVTTEINKYIKEHNLQDPNNGRIIKADKKLKDLLHLKKGEELTYFNLQKHMSPHFAKKGVPVV